MPCTLEIGRLLECRQTVPAGLPHIVRGFFGDSDLAYIIAN